MSHMCAGCPRLCGDCSCCLPAGDCPGTCAAPIKAFTGTYTSAHCFVGTMYVGLGILGVFCVCCCVYHTCNGCSDCQRECQQCYECRNELECCFPCCFPSKAPTQMIMSAVDPASLVGAEKDPAGALV